MKLEDAIIAWTPTGTDQPTAGRLAITPRNSGRHSSLDARYENVAGGVAAESLTEHGRESYVLCLALQMIGEGVCPDEVLDALMNIDEFRHSVDWFEDWPVCTESPVRIVA